MMTYEEFMSLKPGDIVKYSSDTSEDYFIICSTQEKSTIFHSDFMIQCFGKLNGRYTNSVISTIFLDYYSLFLKC